MKPKPIHIVLALSLVANALLLGIVGGSSFNRTGEEAKSGAENYGSTSDAMDAAWDELPEADRQKLLKQFRRAWVENEAERKQLQLASHAVYEAALKEPLDENELRNAVIVFKYREQELLRFAEDILISHLSFMPPKARAAAAVGLLTPSSVHYGGAGPEEDGGGPSDAEAPSLPKSSSIEGAPSQQR